MFFEKIIEMCHFRKAQSIGYFRHIPLALFEHDFGLLQQPLADELGGCFPTGLFDGSIEVIDVDIELSRKIWRRS